ncbi:helix-turn-helix domain-containing protein [Planomonospora venezuelensis]|uniref:AcrR family transcriptional regulator n=1 Tax=Planomonospora venezuelensis TaxID=1999 RepID=A0A841D248_PLAVE|nr:AcrR family transcriptional regulator [Planomonospora venezuelensis]
MSEKTGEGRRRRRADAHRSAAAVLDAAVRVLGRRPEAGLEEVATAAGVTRQTVYAHFPSRRVLLDAVMDRITAEVVAAIVAADLDAGSAADALMRWLDTSWRIFERYPLLMHPSVAVTDPAESRERHRPINDRLHRLICRGQDTGEFDRVLSPAWLLTATMALGHAAGDEVAAGRLTSAQAGAALRRSVLRLYRAPRTDG